MVLDFDPPAAVRSEAKEAVSSHMPGLDAGVEIYAPANKLRSVQIHAVYTKRPIWTRFECYLLLNKDCLVWQGIPCPSDFANILERFKS